MEFFCRKNDRFYKFDMIPKITIIVLNWNRSNDTINCLKSLEAVNDENFKILLVDNNSKIDSVKNILLKFPNINLLQLDKNYGYSGGNNRGFEHISNDTEFICFLNNDVIVDPNFLSNFRNGIKQFGENYIFGPKIYFEYPSERIWYGGGVVNLQKGQIYHKYIGQKDNNHNSKNCKTEYVTGCCLLISKNNFKLLNGFDESFNMYAEDVDLCLRADKLNIKCKYIPNSKIWHKVSASTGGRFSIQKYIKKISSIQKLVKIHNSELNPLLITFKSIYNSIFHSEK